ncbi:hypothetical protein LHV25_12995 [Providencia rettgeri]|uniref:hypothetical protein n=1 Tax=Providencia rettgeri TaxID=587 RepID=UPI001B382F2D|nr:hypothetical protein [Providencia rettgeri]MBQ0262522.1 hypothetical protein [Providencia rettgeri]MCB4855914.1 hypothetical protein [Providencia rettgeri]MCD6315778.1 hypothetical protein [Providencia rettgeri]
MKLIIRGEVTPTERIAINAALEAHKELKKYDKVTNEISTKTLLKHLPEFTKYLPSDKKLKYTPNMWLNHYVMTIDKEINGGS